LLENFLYINPHSNCFHATGVQQIATVKDREYHVGCATVRMRGSVEFLVTPFQAVTHSHKKCIV